MIKDMSKNKFFQQSFNKLEDTVTLGPVQVVRIILCVFICVYALIHLQKIFIHLVRPWNYTLVCADPNIHVNTQ